MQLPNNPFPPSAFHVTYSKCLILEAEAMAEHVTAVEGCPPPLVCARVLGHLLRLAPAGNPQGQIQRDIALAWDQNMLMHVAALYVSNFISTFKRSSGPTPAPSEHPSRGSFEDARLYAMSMMEESTIDHRTARKWVRCYNSSDSLMTSVRDSSIPVQAAHIIPQCVNKNIGEKGPKRFHAGGVWSILSMFNRDSVIEDLKGNLINRLENILSLNICSHCHFDNLELWLKPVDVRSPSLSLPCA
ncbi:hypothetical protein OG21DRAFT_1422719 [Imleria badia]|nr:hypothetical protein OG21DRAFT_1422719 [Imleria badia]